jgi:hypothetical protein
MSQGNDGKEKRKTVLPFYKMLRHSSSHFLIDAYLWGTAGCRGEEAGFLSKVRVMEEVTGRSELGAESVHTSS